MIDHMCYFPFLETIETDGDLVFVLGPCPTCGAPAEASENFVPAESDNAFAVDEYMEGLEEDERIDEIIG